MIRFAAGLGLSLALILFLVWQQSVLPLEVRISRQLSGEYWYSIEVSGRSVGYLHTRSFGLPDGGWRYTSHTHILLEADKPVNIRKYLEFDSRAPWSLREAQQSIQRGSAAAETVRFVRVIDGLQATDTFGKTISTVHRDFVLGDFLLIERWLLEDSPPLYSRIRAPALAFESGRVRSSAYTLIEREPSGYALQSEASMGATVTRLLPSMLPDSIDVAGTFRFQRTDQSTALNISSPAFREVYLLPVTARIPELEKIESMRLTAMDRETSASILNISARRQTLSEHRGTSLATRGLPDDRIEALLRESELESDQKDEGARIDRLLNLLQERITYREGADSASLTEVLDRGYGECADFADLLTVLAEKSGMAARTVIGLAYRDRKPYGFAFHAWNEVRVDGTWQVVDPTWGQRFADATHLPLDDEDLATLKLYGSQQNALIEVSEIVHHES